MEHAQVIWNFFGLEVNAKTMIMTWIVMAVLLILAFFVRSGADMRNPGRIANFFEWVFDFVSGLVKANIDEKRGANLMSLLVTLILFIFFSNLLGLFPNLTFGVFGHIVEGPTMASPTADLNTTLALAVLVNVLAIILGINYQRGHYFKHYLEPFPPFIFIHLVELLAKPVTMAFRLYGNIFAGETLIALILSMPILGLVFGGFIPQIVWLGFSIFVGAIQSFVFTVLTIVYISQAIGAAEAESH
ncbi:F0F1 ATP synthase subunit A [Candidatus Formimonas warabiya]|uniref:ATP synthase subunit a n=1 Tax=Formimonas warabiya TaxID=1761012 RepID=A0A3G1KU52_FORW1|nr:F0F1 ATP synthase subunit A [Candidatus Formimonas warabiya]ATW25981.1 ATP synthase F0 subunit A [Candidatus Formimonas warabiya]